MCALEQKYTGTKVVRVASAQRLIREGFKKDIGTDRGIYTYGDVTKLIDLTSSGVPVQAETPPLFWLWRFYSQSDSQHQFGNQC